MAPQVNPKDKMNTYLLGIFIPKEREADNQSLIENGVTQTNSVTEETLPEEEIPLNIIQ